MNTSGQTSSFTSYCYQVFLCFRGTDVRYNFLECLHRRLKSIGIDAFRDSEGIRTGEPIMEKLLQCVSDAEVCVPIFSKHFASSDSCLKEVEQMLALKKNILPIFFGVEPDLVRRQLDTDGEFYHNHIDKNPLEVLNKWKAALCEVSRMKGEVLSDIEIGYQNLIDRVVKRLWELLKADKQGLPKHYVEVDHHVQEVLTKLDICYGEGGNVLVGQQLLGKRVVGISGPRGIGKTTLAKSVYNLIRPLFRNNSSCFLHGIRGKVAPEMLRSLQEELIRDLQGSRQKLESLEEGVEFITRKFKNKAVLVVLDDVDHFEQIERLLGGLDWLGPGSRVLITLGKRDLINQFEGYDRMVSEYEVGQLPHDKAEKLFRMHAFQGDSPVEAFTDIARGITEQLWGNPRDIERVGSCLNGKKGCNQRGLWQEMREMLKGVPVGHIEKLVKPSHDNLDENTNHIFLDIACLFNGMDKTVPSHLWKACDKYPNWGMYNLWSLYMLNFGENNVLQMPEQTVKCGKRKVRVDGSHPLKRSRIWDLDDANQALEDVKGQDEKKVKALFLADDIQPPVSFSYPQLCFLSELQVLRLSRAKLYGNPTKIIIDRSSSNKYSVPTKIVPGQERAPRKTILPELRWLSWQGCDGVSLLHPLHAEHLVILDLSGSGVSFTKSTECWRKFFKGVKRLRVLDLSGCSGVLRIFPLPTCLERLILDRCGSPFPKQCNSIRNLHNLVYLSIRHCQLGNKLPKDLIELKSLTELLIDGTGIIELPKDVIKQLEVLSANDCTNLKSIPQFEESSRMRVLSFKGCKKVHEIPDSIGNLVCLEVLVLSETMIKKVPNSFGRLQKLKVVRMRRTFLEEVPEVVNKMRNLRQKDFSECSSLKAGGGAAAAVRNKIT